MYKKSNFYLFFPWKYNKTTLKSSKIEEIPPYCPDSPNEPKHQIRFMSLAVDLSVHSIFYLRLGLVLLPPPPDF